MFCDPSCVDVRPLELTGLDSGPSGVAMKYVRFVRGEGVNTCRRHVVIFGMGVLLALLIACRGGSRPSQEEAESAQADSFVREFVGLASAGDWRRVSEMIDPKPTCSTSACIGQTLSRVSDGCAPVVGDTGAYARLSILAESVEIFAHLDGFSATVRMTNGVTTCEFGIDVHRRDGTGPYYVGTP